MKKLIGVGVLVTTLMAGVGSAEAHGGPAFRLGIGLGFPLFYPPPVVVYSPPPPPARYYVPAPAPDRIVTRQYRKGGCDVTVTKTYRDGVVVNRETTRDCGNHDDVDED